MPTLLIWIRRALIFAAVAVAGLTVPAAAVAVAWVWPLQPRPPVLRDFDPPPKRWQSGHRGVDLAAQPGASVLAAGAGEVTYAGLLAGRGVVTVTHGSLRTTYEPVGPLVSVGQRVAAGDVIGRLENAVAHCGTTTCLHWGLRLHDEYLNPLTLLRAGPSRLLPVWGVPAPYSAAVPPGPRAVGLPSGRRPPGVLAAPGQPAEPSGAPAVHAGLDDPPSLGVAGRGTHQAAPIMSAAGGTAAIALTGMGAHVIRRRHAIGGAG